MRQHEEYYCVPPFIPDTARNAMDHASKKAASLNHYMSAFDNSPASIYMWFSTCYKCGEEVYVIQLICIDGAVEGGSALDKECVDERKILED